MKILVSSRQIFEDHTDSISEEHLGEVTILENGFEIKYDNSEINLFNDRLMVKNENMNLIIEPDKANSSKLKTPYGVIQLDVLGESIKWNENPFWLEVRYRLKMGQMQEYINELRLQILDED